MRSAPEVLVRGPVPQVVKPRKKKRAEDDEEDPDDWLNVDASGFDEMLEKTMGGSKGKGKATDTKDVDVPEDDEDRIAKAQAERLRDLAKKVEQFVEGEGDLDGARFAE